jgi:two-component system sensor histidine kinase BaeS
MKLNHKLTLAFLFVSLIAIGLATIFIWGRISYEFNRYVADQRQNEFVIAATTYYQNNNSWNSVDTYLRTQNLLPPLTAINPPPQPYILVDVNRAVIVASAPYVAGEKIKKGEIDKGIPVEVNGQIVGTVISTGQPLTPKPIDQKYADQINQSLWMAGIGGMLIALILGSLLSRSLTHPIRDLTTATRALASGKLEQQVPVRSKDELGELAESFNQMSADLARANQSRRQMTADIAHDLRNPLTVIGGYLESLQDGKLKPTPERFKIMQAEVQHLQHLVDDLRILSLADAGELSIHKQPVIIKELLKKTALTYQHQAQELGIQIKVDIESNLPEIQIDLERMEQVLGNLVSNALRYTPEGGEISLSAKQSKGSLVVSIKDNGSGISPDVLPHIFERSYRGDTSRSGNESGLGLAIAKSIVELHGGSIRAESGKNGSEFFITLKMGSM